MSVTKKSFASTSKKASLTSNTASTTTAGKSVTTKADTRTKKKQSMVPTIASTTVNGKNATRKAYASKKSLASNKTSTPSQNPPPGAGWTSKVVVDNGGRNRCHWISPVRKIGFRNHTQASEFEELRTKFDTDEVQAWAEYRKIKEGVDTYVVSPKQYDPDPNEKSARKRKLSGEGGQAIIKPTKRQRTSLMASDKTRNRSGKLPKDSGKAQCQSNHGSKKKNAICSSARKAKKTHSLQDEGSKKSNLLDSPFKVCSAPTPENGLNCSQYKVIRHSTKKKTSFFDERFPNRIHYVESSLKDAPPEKTVMLDGMKFSLASAKLIDDKQGWNQFMKEKKIELLYIPQYALQKELEKICSFSRMSPGKAVARLALLQSESHKVLYIDTSKIESIEEQGHEGCGFYPEGFFDGWGRKSYDAMQVRIIGPKVGLAKGMLLKKRGITCIQLPSSMLKVPPSKTCTETWVAIVVNNVFPSEGNNLMGRFLDPDAKDVTKSWKGRFLDHATKSGKNKNTMKSLSPMYKRMLVGFGVKESNVNLYARQSIKDPKTLKHVHLKGVIDPTGKLPENKVFIAGYTTDSDNKRQLFGKVHKKVYISRSPCMEPGDAKIVSVVGSKPKDMSVADWNLLCSYRFGTIIFSQSRESAPLPCVIADGDLDGDGKMNLAF